MKVTLFLVIVEGSADKHLLTRALIFIVMGLSKTGRVAYWVGERSLRTLHAYAPR